jgi:uncharacterized integral membrane protein (TIGR00697 family)
MNEIYWVVMLLVNFLLILGVYQLFGKNGLFVWIPISAIVANIQVIQTIELFGYVATLGNIVYASSFLVTDILSEKYGKKEAQKAVWIGFFSVISMTILMWIALRFMPIDEALSQASYNSLQSIFSFMPRIVLASLSAYLLSQLHDVWAFHFWKVKLNNRHLWFRNNVSTMISQLIDSVVFTLIAFYGLYPTDVLIEIGATTYLLKWIVAAADTPFVYLSRIMKPSKIFDS